MAHMKECSRGPAASPEHSVGHSRARILVERPQRVAVKVLFAPTKLLAAGQECGSIAAMCIQSSGQEDFLDPAHVVSGAIAWDPNSISIGFQFREDLLDPANAAHGLG